MICKWAYGVPADMMYAPVSLLVTDSPVVFGSNGHRIIQCGPIVMGGLVSSDGSNTLRCVAPASMYMMPGSAFVGLALCAAISALHCRAASFEHDAGRPRTLGLPDWHVKPLLPSRRTTLLPCASAPTIRAESVTCRGPAAIARAIWTSAGSPAAPPLSSVSM